MFMIAPEGPAYALMAGEMDALGVTDYNVDLSDIEQAGNLRDDTAFNQSLLDIRTTIKSSSTVAGGLTQFGMIDSTASR